MGHVGEGRIGRRTGNKAVGMLVKYSVPSVVLEGVEVSLSATRSRGS